MNALPYIALVLGVLALITTAAHSGPRTYYSAPVMESNGPKRTPHSQHWESATFIEEELMPVVVKGYPADDCPICKREASYAS